MFHTNLASRKNYLKECEYSLEKIHGCVDLHKSKGRRVVLNFGGDIYHGSYDSVFSGNYWADGIKELCDKVDEANVCLGNHETTYYKENPFWTLIKDIESEKVRKIVTKAWKPQGRRNVLRVVDKITEGNVDIHFNHYGTPITKIDKLNGNDINVGLFHSDLYAKEIVEEMEKTKGLSIFEHNPVYFTNSTILDGYDYAFFAHMHKLYGVWDYVCEGSFWKTVLYYLGSLGRTNVTEVKDNFLERNIPAVIVTDGQFSTVEDFKFNLMDRDSTVDEVSVAINKVRYEKRKEVQQMMTYGARSHDDPVINLRSRMSYDPKYLAFFDKVVSKPKTDLEETILRMVEETRKL